jgi:flagellar biosynthetic protein FlhB
MSGDDGEKTHEPSPRRLAEARKRGDVPRSADLTTAAVNGGLLLAALVTGASGLQQAASAAMGLIDQSERLAPMILRAGRAPAAGLLADFLVPILLLLLLPMVGAVLSLVAQRGLILSPDKVVPKLSRISPVAALGQKFGRDGLFAFAKSVVKLVVVCLLVGLLLPRHWGDLLASPQASPGQSVLLLLRIVIEFLCLALLAALVFGGLDYGWQVLQHRRRNRMSRQDLVEENRDSEGDPHMKGHRRQRGRDIATSQMLQDVGRADVVLVNPTHYAVALKWQRGDRSAPICLAKGVDEVAARIRERAAAAGIPIHRDPATARAIHATVEVGRPIRPEHFKAVAAAIRFAEAMRRRARARR